MDRVVGVNVQYIYPSATAEAGAWRSRFYPALAVVAAPGVTDWRTSCPGSALGLLPPPRPIGFYWGAIWAGGALGPECLMCVL